MRVHFVFFLAALIVGVAGIYVPQLTAWPSSASPFLAGAALFASAAIPIASVVVVLCLVIPSLKIRRAICRIVCPCGFCFEILGKVRKKTTGSNQSPRFLRRVPKLGLLLAVFTWCGCLFGFVGFLWLDPFVLFTATLRGTAPLIFVFLFLLVLSWFAPGLWCRCFCPLGGVQDLLYTPKELYDGICEKSERKLVEKRYRFARRNLLVVFLVFPLSYFFRPKRAISQEPLLRPPGAVAEPRFSALCCRCGACVKNCPTQILKMVSQKESLLFYATPQIVFGPGWCKSDCVACSQACPSGAIRKFSLQEKDGIKMGVAQFTFEYCRLYEDVECSICARECPYDAISYQWSEEEYRRIVIIDAKKCNGCGRCMVSCPVVRDAKQSDELPLRIEPIPSGTSVDGLIKR